jgi:hypothetical protein
VLAVLIRVITEPRAAERIAQRPDWQRTLHERLVDLDYIQPSMVHFIRDWSASVARQTQSPTLALPLTIPTMTISKIFVGDLETPTQVEDLPVEPGEAAVVLFIRGDTSDEEFRLTANQELREMRAALRALEGEVRKRQFARDEAHLVELDRIIGETKASERRGYEHMRNSVRARAEDMRRPPRRRRTRIGDRLMRDLFWLRGFLTDGRRSERLADGWAALTAEWAGRRPPKPTDPIAIQAHAEWSAVRRRAEAVDGAAVTAGLERWLGTPLGPNPKTRPDPLSPGGYRLGTRLGVGGEREPE